MANPEKPPVELSNNNEIITVTTDIDSIQKAKDGGGERRRRGVRIAFGIGRTVALVILLYFFICSLDLMSNGFRLVGGKATSTVLQESIGLSSPVAGLMVGILITVLVQSSSTSTSIIVSMTAAGLLDVRAGIPVVMGANVGTSVTSTIVSFTHAGQREDFGRAFSGATVHDCFNWLTVIVLLPLEITTGYLYHTSLAIVNSLSYGKDTGGIGVNILKQATDPFTRCIVQLNSSVITAWSQNNPDYDNATLLKTWCKKDNSTGELVECEYLLKYLGSIGDTAVGAILLVASLILLFLCMGTMVKMLQTLLKGPMASAIRRTINAEVPKAPWLGGYISLIVGCLATVLLQSSSVVTSLLTPLVGLGLVSLERAYPLTIGSNLGTTGTALLASLSSSTSPPLQMALTHMLFNATGILLFYPIPFMRWPVPMAYALGRAASKRRWMAIVYLIVAFLLLPTLVFVLSKVDETYITLYCVLSIAILIVVCIIVINLLQKRHPQVLPQRLRDWKWLPLWMRSLGWADNSIEAVGDFFARHSSGCRCCSRTKTDSLKSVEMSRTDLSEGVDNNVVIVERQKSSELDLTRTSEVNDKKNSAQGCINLTYDSSV
ncbi:sodium-dependent phosphate transport protein 2B-like isoform X2 [Ischnura elegans]|uniref:sodium-dependent phosphate transport protein 2B-like isoform X2 n=1 Tax=Ischnura elegans TaxID=197161 RepID=UPI001ED86EFF|nr:sodium-dependent phosphate transport protein 2B-like isoform X2 [Ischnura elegans]